MKPDIDPTVAASASQRSQIGSHEVISLTVAGLAAIMIFVSAKEVFSDFAAESQVGGAERYAEFAAGIANLLFLGLMMVLLVTRRRPVSKARGLTPRLTAIAGTFMVWPLVLATDAQDGLLPILVGLTLVAVGIAAAIYMLAYLGRSFSVMAEARQLVATGPYAVVRHPLYVAEEVAVAGIVVQRFSFTAVALLLVHIAIQRKRALNEEQVLAKAFPEYRNYAARTRRFLPGIY